MPFLCGFYIVDLNINPVLNESFIGSNPMRGVAASSETSRLYEAHSSRMLPFCLSEGVYDVMVTTHLQPTSWCSIDGKVCEAN